MVITTNHTMQKRMLCPDVSDKQNGQADEEGKKYGGRVVFSCVCTYLWPRCMGAGVSTAAAFTYNV